MSTVTELVTSCANAEGDFGPFSISVLATSTATSSASTPLNASSIGFSVVSSAAIHATPAIYSTVYQYVVDHLGARVIADDFNHDALTSHGTASATATPSAVTGESPSESAAITATVDVQIVALESLVSTAEATAAVALEGASQALWVNAKTMAAAVWSGLPFDSYAMVGGRLMASGLNLVTFGAGNDAGAPIDARVLDDWRAYSDGHDSRFVSAYITARSPGPMRVGVETAKNGLYTYDTVQDEDTSHFVNHRAVFGRGLTGEYARLSFYNIDGQDFDVASLSIYAFARPRRIGG